MKIVLMKVVELKVVPLHNLPLKLKAAVLNVMKKPKAVVNQLPNNNQLKITTIMLDQLRIMQVAKIHNKIINNGR